MVQIPKPQMVRVEKLGGNGATPALARLDPAGALVLRDITTGGGDDGTRVSIGDESSYKAGQVHGIVLNGATIRLKKKGLQEPLLSLHFDKEDRAKAWQAAMKEVLKIPAAGSARQSADVPSLAALRELCEAQEQRVQQLEEINTKKEQQLLKLHGRLEEALTTLQTGQKIYAEQQQDLDAQQGTIAALIKKKDGTASKSIQQVSPKQQPRPAARQSPSNATTQQSAQTMRQTTTDDDDDDDDREHADEGEIQALMQHAQELQSQMHELQSLGAMVGLGGAAGAGGGIGLVGGAAGGGAAAQLRALLGTIESQQPQQPPRSRPVIEEVPSPLRSPDNQQRPPVAAEARSLGLQQRSPAHQAQQQASRPADLVAQLAPDSDDEFAEEDSAEIQALMARAEGLQSELQELHNMSANTGTAPSADMVATMQAIARQSPNGGGLAGAGTTPPTGPAAMAEALAMQAAPGLLEALHALGAEKSRLESQLKNEQSSLESQLQELHGQMAELEALEADAID